MPDLGVCKCCFGKVSSEAKACPHCGQPDPCIAESNKNEEYINLIKAIEHDMKLIKDISEETKQHIRQLIRNGDPINAIKSVREATGWDLKKAKEFVERLGK